MKIIHRLISKFKGHRGEVVVVVALMMTVLIGIAALSIDVGYITTTKSELKNVADAAVLAAARELGDKYVEQQSYVCDKDDIVDVVNEVAEQNKAGGEYITIRYEDVIIGKWEWEESKLTQTLNQPNAVRVTARRDSSANTPITTFFAKIFGIDDIEASASATAALTGLSKAPPGKVELPVGISRKWFEEYYCDKPITFCGKDDYAAWHCFNLSNDSHCCHCCDCNCHTIRYILPLIEKREFEFPEIIAGKTELYFTKCGCGCAFDELDSLFRERRDDEEPYDEWTTTVVVYDRLFGQCQGKSEMIIGFASITIKEIKKSGKEIVADVVCKIVESSKGAGGVYGTYITIPSLVE